MALDETAKEINYQKSLKKFFIDNIKTAEGITVIFDRDWTAPPDNGSSQWVSVDDGSLIKGSVFKRMPRVFCCTRSDPEGASLAALRDLVLGYLTETSRMPLYNCGVSPWVKVGSMVITFDPESGVLRAPDGSKYIIIPIVLRWGAKL